MIADTLRPEYLAPCGDGMVVANDYLTSNLLIGPPDGVRAVGSGGRVRSVGGGHDGWWAAAGDDGVVVGRGTRFGEWSGCLVGAATAATTDGARLWAAVGREVHEHDLASGALLASWSVGEVAQLAIDPVHGRLAATCPDDQKVVIIEAAGASRREVTEADGVALSFPRGVGVGPDGSVLVTDTEGRRAVDVDRDQVWRVDRPGFPVGIAGSPEASPLVSVPYEALVGRVDDLPTPLDCDIFYPYALARWLGDVVVTQPATGCVRRLSDGSIIGDGLADPIALVAWHDQLVVAERDRGRIVLFGASGRSSVPIGPGTQPRALAVSSDEDLFVLTQTPAAVVVVTAEGGRARVRQRVPLDGVITPRAMAVDADGRVVVASARSTHRFDPALGREVLGARSSLAPVSLCHLDDGRIVGGVDEGAVVDVDTGAVLIDGLITPRGIMAEGGSLLVAESLAHRVTRRTVRTSS
jgi:DNA-binding beta-propeller fold protein YncE